MALPLKISPCPIISSNVELRLERIEDIPSDAVFGIIYSSLKNEYSNLKTLPILELPKALRVQTEEMRFSPHYQLFKDNFILQIGPEAISLGANRPYIGWESYFEELNKTLSNILRSGIFNKTLRIGIRYINFFDENIFENINLKINMEDVVSLDNDSVFRTQIKHKNFSSTLQVANTAEVSSDNQKYSGSVVDIDTSISFEGDRIENEVIFRMITEGHDEEKKLFFSLLKTKFVEKNFNPAWE